MYNTKVICSYPYYDPELRKLLPESECNQTHLDILGEDEYPEESADWLYRAELLQIFGLEQFDEDRIVKEVAALFPQVKNYFADLTMKLANQMLSNDEEFGFVMMFSYNTLFAIHKCMCEFMETNTISENTLLFLKKVLEK